MVENVNPSASGPETRGLPQFKAMLGSTVDPVYKQNQKH